MLHILEDEDIAKLRAIASRLQAGSDLERDEGHKLWLVVKEGNLVQIEDDHMDELSETSLRDAHNLGAERLKKATDVMCEIRDYVATVTSATPEAVDIGWVCSKIDETLKELS